MLGSCLHCGNHYTANRIPIHLRTLFSSYGAPLLQGKRLLRFNCELHCSGTIFKIHCEIDYCMVRITFIRFKLVKQKFDILYLLQAMTFIRCFDMNYIRQLDEVKLAPPFEKTALTALFGNLLLGLMIVYDVLNY